VANTGQELHGPGGLVLRIVRADPEVLEMEARYAGDGPMPPSHFHPSQTERFEVLEGTMTTVIAGVERAFETGSVFEVPAGMPHQMAADGPARLRWEVRPALRTADFFERMYTAPPQGPEEGAEFLREFSAEFRLT
jgi:mannose-6-phosphate isomerase-like protein (cupin superfamily)